MSSLPTILTAATMYGLLTGGAQPTSPAPERIQSPTRTIDVDVVLRSENAGAIEGVVILGVPLSEARLWARTNKEGRCTLHGEVPTDCDRLEVVLAPFPPDDHTVGEEDRDGDRYTFVADNYTFRHSYHVAIERGVDTYALTITCYPFIRVTGRAVDQAGQPVTASLCWWDAPQSVWPCKRNPPGLFDLDRVRRGEPVEIFLSGPELGPVVSLALTGQQTRADISVGDVVVPTLRGDSPVKIAAKDFDRIDRIDEETRYARMHNDLEWRLHDEVAVIAADGSRIFRFPISVDGLAASSRTDRSAPSIPSGSYYVVPGPFWPDCTGLELLRLIRARRIAELEAAGVPRLNAEKGVEASVTVDGPATVRAIRDLMDR